jgi:hypothetical protein
MIKELVCLVEEKYMLIVKRDKVSWGTSPKKKEAQNYFFKYCFYFKQVL